MSQQKHDHMWSSFQEAILEEKVGELVSGILRREHGREPSPVKKISRRTGIAPTTIRKWYTSKKPPSIGHFLMLVQQYPEILKAFLEASGYGYLTAHIRPIVGEKEDDMTTVTAPAEAAQDVPINVPNRILSERQAWFLILLGSADRARAEDISAEFGVSLKTAKRDIEGLKTAGKIRFIGSKRSGRYEIVVSDS